MRDGSYRLRLTRTVVVLTLLVSLTGAGCGIDLGSKDNNLEVPPCECPMLLAAFDGLQLLEGQRMGNGSTFAEGGVYRVTGSLALPGSTASEAIDAIVARLSAAGFGMERFPDSARVTGAGWSLSLQDIDTFVSVTLAVGSAAEPATDAGGVVLVQPLVDATSGA